MAIDLEKLTKKGLSTLSNKLEGIKESQNYTQSFLNRVNHIDLTKAIDITKLNIRGYVNPKTNEVGIKDTLKITKDGTSKTLNIEPLYSIRGFYDYLDLVNKKIYKRITYKKLTGTESWTLASTDSVNLYFRINVPATGWVSRPAEDTIIYTSDDNITEICLYDSQFTVKFKKGKLSEDTLDAFKTYLSNHNIDVYYLNKNYNVQDISIDMDITPGVYSFDYKSNTSFLDCEYTVALRDKKIEKRIFKPQFCQCIDYIGTPTNATGGVSLLEDAKLEEDAERMAQLGLDDTIMVFDSDYNETTHEMFMIANDEKYLKSYSIYKNKRIKVTKVKLHTYFYRGSELSNSSYIRNVITKEVFETQYKLIVNHLLDFVKTNMPDVKEVILFNELDDEQYGILRDSDYANFTVECLDLVSQAGYKCGVSNAGYTGALAMPEIIKEKVDKFYINSYFPISSKLENTSLEDAVNAISNSLSVMAMKNLYEKYNKKTFISETGCLDKWGYMIAPAAYNLEEYPRSYGMTEKLYCYGLFESLDREYIDGVTYWWDLYYDEVIPVINHYMRGVDM